MNIDKAIKKQNKSYKRFITAMGFIFLVLPAVMILFGKIDLFYIIYAGIIELLIMMAVLISVDNQYLKYEYDSYRLKIKLGVFKNIYNIICDKVIFVHAEGNGPQFTLIILTTSKFRNKRVRAVDSEFLKKHPFVGQNYYRLKKIHPEEKFYYIVITKGGYSKFKLLDTIFRSCVYASFSDEAVKNIKEYRNE